MSIAQTVKEQLTPIVLSIGYEIVDVEYVKKQNGMNLTIFIDSDHGIALNDCEKVHTTIDPILDELDPTNGASYTLNVSSPGLDRPIKTEEDLKRHLGKDIEVNLYAKLNGKKEYVGKLVSFNENELVIEADGKQVTIERKNISKINNYISF